MQRWLELMRVDKKTQGRVIRFVLLDRLGQARVAPVPDDRVEPVLAGIPAGRDAGR